MKKKIVKRSAAAAYPRYYDRAEAKLARLYRVLESGACPQFACTPIESWNNSIEFYTETELRKRAKRISAKRAKELDPIGFLV